MKFQLRVITPENIALDEQCDMVIVRCVTGDMGFLAKHEPTSAILGDGDMRIFNDKNERSIHVSGGIVQVKDDVVTILTGRPITDAENELETA